MNLNFNYLRLLLEVHEHGSLRATARALGVSQSALSKSVRQIEQATGAVLLHRSGTGVRFTREGERVLQYARVIVDELQGATDQLQRMSEAAQGRVSAVLAPSVVVESLGTAYHWFRQRHPATRLCLREGFSTDAIEALRARTADVALVLDHGDLRRGEFHVRRLAQAQIACVVRRGHPELHRPGQQRPDRLQWLVAGPADGPEAAYHAGLFARAGLPQPRGILHGDGLVSMRLLLTTDAVTLWPRQIVRSQAGYFAELPIPELSAPPLELKVVARRDLPLVPAAEYLIECLAQAWRTGTSSTGAAPWI